MKSSSNNLSSLLSNIKLNKIKGVLLHGSDRGVVNNIFAEITKLLEYEVRVYSYNELEATGLDVVFYSSNLFSKLEIIKITNVPFSISASIKEMLLMDGRKNFPLFVADELSPASSIRKWFEEQDFFVSVGCYTEDKSKLINLVKNYVNSQDKKISEAAIDLLLENYSYNRDLLIRELEKLTMYCYDSDYISVQNVEKCTSNKAEPSADLMCIYFAKVDGKSYLAEISKLKLNNIPDVWILRALIRYYLNLYQVLIKINRNALSISIAIKEIKPPIFFKFVDQFQQIVRSTNIESVLNILEKLQKAEALAKTNLSYKLSERVFFWVHRLA